MNRVYVCVYVSVKQVQMEIFGHITYTICINEIFDQQSQSIQNAHTSTLTRMQGNPFFNYFIHQKNYKSWI